MCWDLLLNNSCNRITIEAQRIKQNAPVYNLRVQNFLIPILLLTAGFVCGAVINYLSDVLPRDRKFTQAVCRVCGTPQRLFPYVLNPFSYADCGHRRPFRDFAVCLTSIGFAFWMWYVPPEKLGSLAGFVLLLYFLVIVVIDLEHRLILHPVAVVGMFLCGVVGFWRHGLTSTLIGGIAGFVIMLGLYLFGDLFTRWLSKRRQETVEEVALGFGDVNLAGVIGLLLGWPGIVPGVILAILLGGLGSILYLAWMAITRRYQAFSAIPYGPFLVLGSVILLFF